MSTISSIGGSGAVQSALTGIQRGQSKIAQDASTVAASGIADGSDSGTNALLDAKQQSLNVAASARALSIADQTIGTLINIKA